MGILLMPFFGEYKMLTKLRKLTPEAQEYINSYFSDRKIPYSLRAEPILAIRFQDKFGLPPYTYPTGGETWEVIKSEIISAGLAEEEDIRDILYPLDFPHTIWEACRAYLGKPEGTCLEFYALCDDFVSFAPKPTLRDFIDFISDNSKRITEYLPQFLFSIFFENDIAYCQARQNTIKQNAAEVVLNLGSLHEFVAASPIPCQRARSLLIANPDRYVVCLFGREDKSRDIYNLIFPKYPRDYYVSKGKYILILWDRAHQKWVLNAGLPVEGNFYSHSLAKRMEDVIID